MESTILAWLSDFSSTVFRVALGLFFLVNAAAVAAVVLTRSRAFVNRWTSPWLAANLILIGAGAGTPLLVGAVKVAVRAVAAAGSFVSPSAAPVQIPPSDQP